MIVRDTTCLSHLLSLLSWLSTTLNVAGHVSLVVDGLEHILGGLPGLAGGRWDILALSKSVTTSTKLSDHALDEGALADACAEEDGVCEEDDPAALNKDESGAENAEPKRKLESGHNGHAGVVVVLNKTANGVCKATSWLLACGSGWLWLQDWEKDATSVGEDVEDAVDGVWEKRERVLSGEEPDQGHSKVLHIFITSQSQWAAWLLASLCASAVALEYHNTVCRGCGNEGSAVAELRPAAVVVEEDVAQRVSERGQQEGDVADEPCELERLSKLQQALLQRLIRGRGWRRHGVCSAEADGGNRRGVERCRSDRR